MQVILATDLEANVGTALLASLPWPPGSELDVLHVLPARRALLLGRRQPDGAMVDARREALHVFALAIRAALAEKRVTVRTTMRVGDAAEAIARRAEELSAGMVVVDGLRGRGLFPRSGVVPHLIERAPCSVLIARRDSLRRLVLGDDGSVGADRATAELLASPLLADLPVSVVHVMDEFTPVFAAPHVPTGERAALRISRSVAQSLVDDRVGALRGADRYAQGLLREGTPWSELIAAAESLDADCIVLGPSGSNAFSRFLLGSVARTVAVDAPCSVLIARPT